MEIDLGAFLVIVYSLVDDLYQSRYAPLKPRRRGRKAELSDSEVLTLAVLCQWQLSRSESAFVEYVLRHWKGYFPRMLTQGAFNRRVRDLAGVLCRLGPEVAVHIQAYIASGAAYEVIDGVPVPLMRRCRGNRHRLFANEAAIGRGGSDSDWYYGVKLLLAVSPEGLVTGFVFGPANTEERWLADALLGWRFDPGLPAPTAERLAEVLGPSHQNGGGRQGPTGPIFGSGAGRAEGMLYLGDLGYRGREWAEHWRREYQALVQTKADYDRLAYVTTKPEVTEREAREGRHLLASLRQVVETVNSYLDGVLGLKYPRARSLSGLLARIGAKIAALNIAIYINLSNNRRTLSQFNPFLDYA